MSVGWIGWLNCCVCVRVCDCVAERVRICVDALGARTCLTMACVCCVCVDCV